MKTLLSEREMQVAELLAWGHSDKEVAEELFISFDTARTHHHNIYAKLNLKNASDLTRWYFQETQNYNFGFPPKMRLAITMLFILLAFSIEYFNITALRVKAFRAQAKTAAKSKGRQRRETYELATV